MLLFTILNILWNLFMLQKSYFIFCLLASAIWAGDPNEEENTRDTLRSMGVSPSVLEEFMENMFGAKNLCTTCYKDRVTKADGETYEYDVTNETEWLKGLHKTHPGLDINAFEEWYRSQNNGTIAGIDDRALGDYTKHK